MVLGRPYAATDSAGSVDCLLGNDTSKTHILPTLYTDVSHRHTDTHIQTHTGHSTNISRIATYHKQEKHDDNETF